MCVCVCVPLLAHTTHRLCWATARVKEERCVFYCGMGCVELFRAPVWRL